MPRVRAPNVWLPLLVIHASMMASVIMYGIIGFTVSADGPPSTDASRGLVLAIVAVVAALCAIASFVAKARMMPAADPDLPAPTRLGKVRGALIVAWALCEAVAICGLVPTLIFRDVSTYAPFGAAALVLLLVHAPRLQRLAALMR